jgi:hypothetical protein
MPPEQAGHPLAAITGAARGGKRALLPLELTERSIPAGR